MISTWTRPWDEIAERVSELLPGRWVTDVPFGPDGVALLGSGGASLILTAAPYDGAEWTHASMARPDRVPSYMDLCAVKRAVWGDDGFAYQVFPSTSRHVSIHQNALHLWGRSDGANVLPDFGAHGTI